MPNRPLRPTGVNDKPPAHTCLKNGGKIGKPYRGSFKDHYGKSVLDPRLMDGEMIPMHPRSEAGKRRLEELRTKLGMTPITRSHRWGKGKR